MIVYGKPSVGHIAIINLSLPYLVLDAIILTAAHGIFANIDLASYNEVFTPWKHRKR